MTVKENDKDLMDDILDEEDEDTQKDKYLTFRVAKEFYAIEIVHIREIIKLQKITEVPETEDFLKGVINLRGKVIPVIDVRKRFHMSEREYDDRTCIVVVNMNDILTGLIVDRVAEVLDIPEKNVDPAPSGGGKGSSRFIKSMGKIGDDVKMILDIEQFLKKESMEKIAEIAESHK